MKIWHKDVFWPKSFPKTVSLESNVLVLTKHARERMREKRINLPAYADWDIIELTDEDKITIRTRLNETNDVVCVVRKDKASLILLTAWTNRAKDGHAGLNRSIYESSPDSPAISRY